MFILFRGDTYYPGGGWEDYGGNFLTLEAAILFAHKNMASWYWWHIVELEEMTIVRRSDD